MEEKNREGKKSERGIEIGNERWAEGEIREVPEKLKKVKSKKWKKEKKERGTCRMHALPLTRSREGSGVAFQLTRILTCSPEKSTVDR